jgi:hypothetical protein
MSYLNDASVVEPFDGFIAQNFDDNEHMFADFVRRSRSKRFNPDVTGYNLIYLIAPDLSGSEDDNEYMQDIAKASSFLALEFGPPETTVKATEESSGSSIRIPYATGKSSGGQLSINFIEDSDLNITKFHTIWVNYMADVIYGDLSPDDKYMDPESPEFGSLDYATSAYVVKFKPDMKTITYVGKATGIFPVNMPSKEVIGSRQSNELTMVGMNYMCADYNTIIMPEDDETYMNSYRNNWVYGEFINDMKAYFGVNV